MIKQKGKKMSDVMLLRTKDGHLKASFSNDIAYRILRDCRGRWEEKDFVDGGKQSCFVNEADMTYGMDHFKVHLWEGDYMISKRD